MTTFITVLFLTMCPMNDASPVSEACVARCKFKYEKCLEDVPEWSCNMTYKSCLRRCE